MGGCRCTFRHCENSTSSRPGMHFFHFPIRDWPRLEIWATNAEKLEFKELPIAKLKNKVVCEEHFKNRMFMNYLKESLVKTAVPSLEVLEDGRVYDLETNLIGEREEWDIPEERKESSVGGCGGGSGTVDDPLLVPIDGENTRMEIQFLDTEEVVTGETTYSVSPVITNDTPILLNRNPNPVPIKLSLVEKPKPPTIVPAATPPTTPTTSTSNTILRKVVFKRKIPPSNATVPTGGSAAKVQVLSVQKVPSQSPLVAKKERQIVVVQQEDTVSAEETQPVAIPSSSTDIETVKSPPQVIVQSVPVDPPALPPPAPAPPPQLVMDPAMLEQLERNSSEIAHLKKLLVDVLNRPIPEPQVITVPVPTPVPAAPTPSSPSSPKPEKGPHMNKVQLFNGIKRYLNPTMVALLRVEMFGGSAERQWKADEKTLAVELVSLGENVYDHFCDEFRFRLPAKKDALKWKEQALDDDDDAS